MPTLVYTIVWYFFLCSHFRMFLVVVSLMTSKLFDDVMPTLMVQNARGGGEGFPQSQSG